MKSFKYPFNQRYKNKKRKFQDIENYIEKSPGLGSMTEQDCDGGTVNELFYINIESKPEIKSPKETKKSKHTIVWEYFPKQIALSNKAWSESS